MSSTADLADTPLLDHFRPPLSTRRHWHAFHNAWATYLASDLNALLPDGFFAESNVQFGIEIDVAAFEDQPAGLSGVELGPQPGPVVATWPPPAPAVTVPFAPVAETVEVRVFDSREGPVLAGAIELVSPANKDCPAHRQAFVSKCETYLQSGAGLVIVDVVTHRHADLHRDLLARVVPADATAGDDPKEPATSLYAAAYRAIEREGQGQLDLWHDVLDIGASLPVMPLWLRDGPCLPVNLAASYHRTCLEQRVSVRSA